MAERERGERRGKGEGRGFRRRGMGRRKVCRFCADKTMLIDYKDSRVLGTFLSERGKIIPTRTTGYCARHQRHLTLAIKRPRTVALLPFTAAYPRGVLDVGASVPAALPTALRHEQIRPL